jgi:hypothetical protein
MDTTNAIITELRTLRARIAALETVERPVPVAQPAFLVYKTSNQAGVASGTDTKATWQAKDVEVGMTFDLANNQTSLAAGHWMMTVSIIYTSFVAALGNVLNVKLFKNGAALRTPSGVYLPNATGYHGVTVSIPVFHVTNEADVYSIYVLHNTGSDRTILSGASTFWSGVRM